jgi:hypothetical protein
MTGSDYGECVGRASGPLAPASPWTVPGRARGGGGPPPWRSFGRLRAVATRYQHPSTTQVIGEVQGQEGCCDERRCLATSALPAAAPSVPYTARSPTEPAPRGGRAAGYAPVSAAATLPIGDAIAAIPLRPASAEWWLRCGPESRQPPRHGAATAEPPSRQAGASARAYRGRPSAQRSARPQFARRPRRRT